MQKALSKILISVMLVGIFMLPFSGRIQVKNQELLIAIEESETLAQQENEPIWGFTVTQTTFSSNPNIQSLITIHLGGSPYTGLTKAACDTEHAAAEANPAWNSNSINISDCTANPETLTSGTFSNVYTNSGQKIEPKGNGVDFGCNPILNPVSIFTNCVLWFIYYVIYTPLASITRVAANILDFFIYYSTSTEAYTGPFVEKGWGVVRDIANIFFIVALLFIAIKTILQLNTTNNKKLLANIIIFALIINFSLFATKVIIDASNILAKIFYHQITPVDSNGVQIGNAEEQRSVTVGLVKVFDPVAMLETSPQELGQTETQAEADVKIQRGDFGQFLLIMLLCIALMVFMIYVFLSVALLFVARVASLWIAMIFSPFAFASNAISTKIKGFGWDEWLSNLLKNAFLAPIFVFFLYIIILFGNLFKLAVPDVSGSQDTWLHPVMDTVIPFMIVFVLLSQAKSIAKEYSGKIGETLSKVGAVAGGLGLAAVTGGTALAARATIGAGAANLAQNERMRRWAAKSKVGKWALQGTEKIASSSFDARGVKVLGKGLADTGLKNMGKAQVGGFAKMREDKVKSQEEFAKKMLDTTEHGMARMTKGGMGADEARERMGQMIQGGMSITQAHQYRQAMMAGGVTYSQAKDIGKYMNVAKRDTYANRIERKSRNNRIAANKIRTSFTSQQQQANLQQMATALAAAIPPPPSPTPPPPAPGGHGGGGGGHPTPPATPPGGGHHPPCWVAEVLYGIDDPRTHSARLWASMNDNWFIRLYVTHGRTWAKWLKVHKWAQPIVKPIWNVMAIKGQTLALRLRSSEILIDKKFNHLLEKVK